MDTFFHEDNELLEKNNDIWNRSVKVLKKNLNTNPSTKNKF